MNQRAKWLSRLILAAAFVTILPVGNLVTKIIYEGVPYQRIVTPRDIRELHNLCRETKAQAIAKGENYMARDYVLDMHKILTPVLEFDLRDEYQPYIIEMCDLAQSNYPLRRTETEVLEGAVDHGEFSREFGRAINDVGMPGVTGFPLKDRDIIRGSGRAFLGLCKWYLKFIPFALMLILLQIQSRKDKIKLRNELGDWRGFLLNVFFWPVGLMKYCDENYRGVVLRRYFNLRVRYEAIKRGDNLYYRLSPEEHDRLWAEAEKSDDYISQVARLAQVSRDLVEQQSLASVWVGATLSLFVFFFTAGRCLAASNELPKTTTAVVVKAKGEDIVVVKKPFESSPEALDQTSPTDHFHQVVVLPSGWIPFEMVAIRPIRLPFIRPPPAPVFPIDHVPWLGN